MFRKISLVVAVLAALAIVPQAHAAAKGDMMLGVRGGASLPMSDFSDLTKTGFLGGADFTYMVNPKFGVGVDGSYVVNKVKDELIEPAVSNGITDAKVTQIQFGANAKYFFPMEGSAMPYIVGGIGGVNGKLETTPDNGNKSSTKGGGRIGLGGNFKAGSSLLVNLEGNFNYVKTKDDATGAKNTEYISILGGVTFPLGGSK
jgi:opacity protein-like surface antigen